MFVSSALNRRARPAAPGTASRRDVSRALGVDRETRGSRVSRRLRQMRRLVPLVSEQQQPGAQHNRAYASPYGNVDCLLVLNRQLDRSQLGFMGLLGVAETAIHQSQDTTQDQPNGHYLDCVHFCSSLQTPPLDETNHWHHDRDDVCSSDRRVKRAIEQSHTRVARTVTT